MHLFCKLIHYDFLFFTYYERFQFFSSNPRSLIIFFAIVFSSSSSSSRNLNACTRVELEATLNGRVPGSKITILLPPHSEAQATLFIFSRKSQSIYYGRSTSFLPSFILYLLAIIRLPLFVKRDPRNACTQQVTRRVKSRGSGSLASAVLRVYFFSLSPFFSPIGRR